MHTIELNSHDKTSRYQQLLPQLAALIEDETDLTANLANICAALKDSFGWLWVGFYRTDNRDSKSSSTAAAPAKSESGSSSSDSSPSSSSSSSTKSAAPAAAASS